MWVAKWNYKTSLVYKSKLSSYSKCLILTTKDWHTPVDNRPRTDTKTFSVRSLSNKKLSFQELNAAHKVTFHYRTKFQGISPKLTSNKRCLFWRLALRRNFKSIIQCHSQTAVYFLVSEYSLIVSLPILDRFPHIILLKNVYGLHLPPRFFAVAIAQTTAYRPFFSFSSKWKTNKLRSNILLNANGDNEFAFKGHECCTIKMDASDYKGLKSETIIYNK